MKALSIVIIAIVLTSCGTIVNFDYEKSTDFTQYKSYNYFDDMETELTDDYKTVLRQVAEQIAGKPQRIEVRGHTMPQPVRKENGIRDHWDLAYERCRNVVEFLVSEGVLRDRIRIGVAGRNEPAYTAHTARVGAEVFGMDYADFAAQTQSNFDALFTKAARPKAAA